MLMHTKNSTRQQNKTCGNMVQVFKLYAENKTIMAYKVTQSVPFKTHPNKNHGLRYKNEIRNKLV
jgi:hypothetical protein